MAKYVLRGSKLAQKKEEKSVIWGGTEFPMHRDENGVGVPDVGCTLEEAEEAYAYYFDYEVPTDHIKALGYVLDQTEDGKYHIHNFVRLDTSEKMSYVSARFPAVDHWEIIVDPAKYIEYMHPSENNHKVEGTYEMRGVVDWHAVTADRQNEKTKEYINVGPTKFFENNAGYLASHHQGLKAASRIGWPEMQFSFVRQWYVYGPGGSGKSHFCTSAVCKEGMTPNNIFMKLKKIAGNEGYVTNQYVTPFPNFQWAGEKYDPLYHEVFIHNEASLTPEGKLKTYLSAFDDQGGCLQVKGDMMPIYARLRIFNTTHSPEEFMKEQSAYDQQNAVQWYRRWTNILRLEHTNDENGDMLHIHDETFDPLKIWGDCPQRRRDLHVTFPDVVPFGYILPREWDVLGWNNLTVAQEEFPVDGPEAPSKELLDALAEKDRLERDADRERQAPMKRGRGEPGSFERQSEDDPFAAQQYFGSRLKRGKGKKKRVPTGSDLQPYIEISDDEVDLTE